VRERKEGIQKRRKRLVSNFIWQIRVLERRKRLVSSFVWQMRVLEEVAFQGHDTG
jgi:hypothetical protein